MSAVAGLYRLDGTPVVASGLRCMLDAMPHCGPDGANVWTDGPIGLGHRMLHTTPESLHERLPLTTPDGTLTITADARIDNRAELIERLGLVQALESISDSALILGAYAAWGLDCLDHLVGDFAFAIWDVPKRTLFCARDHFGIRPFYYHHREGGHFAFGTEIKALLTLPDVPERLNEVRLADFLATMREDPENTIYEEILRLPAAHALVVGPQGCRQWKYYTLTAAADVPADAPDAVYEARFRELFTEAVRARLRSAFPIGSELSGGMDSSAVTCVARQLLDPDETLHTFSLIYDDVEECDERPYINAVLKQGGFTPHYVHGDHLGPLENVEEVYAYLDDGLASGNQHLVWALKKKAQQAGVRVLLDGLDGDNVVGHGLLYLKELAEAGDWKTFAYESHAAAEHFGTTEQRHNFEDQFAEPDAAFKAFGEPRLRQVAEEGSWWQFGREAQAAARYFGVRRSDLYRRHWRRLMEPNALRRMRHARRRAAAPDSKPRAAPILPLLDPAFASRIGLSERLVHFDAQRPRITTERDVQRQLLGGSRIQTALELTTHVGAAHGLEVRHPFFDKRLIEFCLALPARQSLQDGWTRSILRRAIDVLPDAIRWRVGKAWMASNFERGLYDQDRDLLDRHLADLGPLRPYLDVEVVEALYARGRHIPNIEQAQLARVATLACWLKLRFTNLPNATRVTKPPGGKAGRRNEPQAHT